MWVSVLWLFLTVPWVYVWSVIVTFPGHTYLLVFSIHIYSEVFESSMSTSFDVCVGGGGGGGGLASSGEKGWTGQNLKVKIWFLTLRRSNINIQIYEMYPFCHVFHYLVLIYLFTYVKPFACCVFFMFLLSSVDFSMNFISKFSFRNKIKNVKQVGFRSGPTFCRSWSGSKLFAKVISRRQKSSLAGKELNNLTLRETVVNECCSNWRLCQVMR